MQETNKVTTNLCVCEREREQGKCRIEVGGRLHYLSSYIFLIVEPYECILNYIL